MVEFYLHWFLLPLIITLLGTKLLLPILTRAQLFDHPNERSNHKIPVPRGGGLVMLLVILFFLYLLQMPAGLLQAITLLALVSFIDDRKGLSARWRLLAQAAAVFLALQTLPAFTFLPEWIPASVQTILIALAWLWFTNLTNFMDGIDGITVAETCAICLGLVSLHYFCNPTMFVLPQALVIAGAALGFLWFNYPPARLFMGDVGSIPLGFLLAYLLLVLASHGYLAAALILPAYYVTDATVTLLRRLKRGVNVFEAHSEHAYQRAVRAGLTHGQVTTRITLLNLLLILLAIASASPMMPMTVTLLLAYGATALVTLHFHALSHR